MHPLPGIAAIEHFQVVQVFGFRQPEQGLDGIQLLTGLLPEIKRHQVGHIATKPIDSAFRYPKGHCRNHGLPHARIVVVQVDYIGPPMIVVKSTSGISLEIAGVCFRPYMIVTRMIRHPVNDALKAHCFCLCNQCFKIIQGAEFGINGHIIGTGIVTAQAAQAGQFTDRRNGHKPKGIHAHFTQAGKLPGKCRKIAFRSVLPDIHFIYITAVNPGHRSEESTHNQIRLEVCQLWRKPNEDSYSELSKFIKVQVCTFAVVIFFMKSFQVPPVYRSPLITAIKTQRRLEDKLKKDFSPTLLNLGPLQLYLARHFGFCYGVENAIEIAFRTVEENPGKRIFLLSEMIHNPQVNAGLLEKGIRFLQDTGGKQLIPFETLTEADIVIIPAFGTTLELEAQLESRGIATARYNTTCPFVEKVWNRSEQIAARGYSIVIHGKPRHEETRATFSHASYNAPAIILNDMDDARLLADFITGQRPPAEFYTLFNGRYSDGFDVSKDLGKIGVVNQTTQLASDTQAIADFLKQTIKAHYQLADQQLAERFADTRDTLCYATTDNQTAVTGMLKTTADLALVIGGYNSSNTTHLVELCEAVLPTYFISTEAQLLSATEIIHYDFHQKLERKTSNYLPESRPVRLLLTSGASCPDALVEGVIRKLAALLGATQSLEDFEAALSQ